MTLQVTFEEFAKTVERMAKSKEAYVMPHPHGSLATSAKPDGGLVVAALSPLEAPETSAALRKLGMEVFDGTWLTPEEVLTSDLTLPKTFIAGVSYRSGGDKPGIWVDAFPAMPTQVTVLKAMFDEFRQTGEVEDVPFEEFVSFAAPNVVILTPTEIESFLKAKSEC